MCKVAIKPEYLEGLDSYSCFVLLLYHINELSDDLVTHVVDVPSSLRSRGQTEDPINRINVIYLDHNDTKWLGVQPNIYLAARQTWLTISVCPKRLYSWPEKEL